MLMLYNAYVGYALLAIPICGEHRVVRYGSIGQRQGPGQGRRRRGVTGTWDEPDPHQYHELLLLLLHKSIREMREFGGYVLRTCLFCVALSLHF
jgi:hypothetical protein